MKLAVFDFDGTLFKTQTIPYLIRQWDFLGYSKSKSFMLKSQIGFKYFLYKTKLLEKEKFRGQAVEFFTKIFFGMSKQEIKEFFYKASENASQFINMEVVNAIAQAKDNGYHTVLLSGCYSFFLDEFARAYGVDTVIGTCIPFKGKTIDYDSKTVHINGSLKLPTLLKHFDSAPISWECSYAYADSIADLDLLLKVGYPVAVCPDKKLKKVANNSNWKIIC